MRISLEGIETEGPAAGRALAIEPRRLATESNTVVPMSGSKGSLPHLERLLAHLASLDAQIIEVRGWPGSGRAALFEAFLQRHPTEAWALPEGVLEREDWLRREVTQHATARWLVVSTTGEAKIGAALRWLRPGQRLITTGHAGGPAFRGASALGPSDLLLTASEVRALVAREAPALLEHAEALWEASDGWYRPIRLALLAGPGTDAWGSADQLALQPAVASFLRHDVLGEIPDSARRSLLMAPLERPRVDEPFHRWAWIDQLGLWLQSAEGDRLPRVLAAWLRQEAERRGPVTMSPLQTARYEIRLLGDPVIRCANATGTSDLAWTLRRALHILALLASTATLESPRAELIDALWPGEDDGAASRNFHPTLSALRKTLEQGDTFDPRPLLHQAGVYRLNTAYEWTIDVRDFEDHIEAGRQCAAHGDWQRAVGRWLSAWHLYRGAFLQGHYEPWIATRRERYQVAYNDLLRDLGDALARLDRGEEAVDVYRTLLISDPLQERIHLALMRLHSRQGRRDLVRRQYERLRGLLLEELGVEPMPATAREYLRLMA
jgi:DNA-binding SARP family transcriptional activator